LTRASIKKNLFKTMDCRVKPGNDGGEWITGPSPRRRGFGPQAGHQFTPVSNGLCLAMADLLLFQHNVL